jgi:hypothetical protein
MLVSILFLASILAKCVLSRPVTPRAGVPESWRHHKEVFGEFEVWLPEEWGALGDIHTLVYSLREVAGGSQFPLLFSASAKGVDGCHNWIKVKDYDIAFELYAPLVGEDLARECSRNHPVALTGEFDGVVYLDASNVVTIEIDESKSAIAYQSDVLGQSVDNKDLVRTIACVVSRNHVYQVYLDTVEESNSTNASTYERILKSFRVLE